MLPRKLYMQLFLFLRKKYAQNARSGRGDDKYDVAKFSRIVEALNSLHFHMFAGKFHSSRGLNES